MMPEKRTPGSSRIKQRSSAVLVAIFRPSTLLFLVAFINFLWFFSQSSVIQHLGKNSISFCVVCAWYWDWSLTNAPSLSLMATACLFFRGWKGSFGALCISGYTVIEGINWLSFGSGPVRGIVQRIEVISQSDAFNPVWELPDIQYLFATIVLVAALIYLFREVRGSKYFS